MITWTVDPKAAMGLRSLATNESGEYVGEINFVRGLWEVETANHGDLWCVKGSEADAKARFEDRYMTILANQMADFLAKDGDTGNMLSGGLKDWLPVAGQSNTYMGVSPRTTWGQSLNGKAFIKP